jgi:hypothetical protein
VHASTLDAKLPWRQRRRRPDIGKRQMRRYLSQ